MDVLLPAPAAFHPVVDLGTGAVVAVAAQCEPVGPPAALPMADPAREDVRRALLAARAVTELRTSLPLQLSLRAETVAQGRPTLAELHQGLVETGRRPNEIIISVTGGFAPAQRPVLSSALHDLRKAGYLIGLAGLGAAYTPLDLLVDGVPYLVRLDAELARRSSTDPRRSALVASLVELAHRIGTHVLAPGLANESQVLHLRELGVRLVQGPVLAPPEWRPGMRVTVPVAAAEAVPRPRADLGPRVSEFTVPAVTMSLDATAGMVLDAFDSERGTSSIVLVDGHRRPRHTIDRTRFLLTLSGAYGHALHAQKPAARLADPPRVVPKTVPAIAALRAAGREQERVYDDLVVTDEVGRCLGIVRVSDLIRSLSP
ncbi:EAL domain-containing protein [Thermomonospora umbrina]|uniref:EAL domain-containing protein (Putative c-di-GMP-specific phosphodiesterase class I) n=1 Tax=Thermomonospora umbrina TaxID=111806 RepID=A0A3D9SZV3_9ACTN|nr:EAL domain-containing protein [Thermomonospora umbrina]REF01108.1 EAL domain-containing protein (putative c-di-GMP-specific phosphodiesterase class I) [Thermomonospora umbrina]